MFVTFASFEIDTALKSFVLDIIYQKLFFIKSLEKTFCKKMYIEI